MIIFVKCFSEFLSQLNFVSPRNYYLFLKTIFLVNTYFLKWSILRNFENSFDEFKTCQGGIAVVQNNCYSTLTFFNE